MSTPIFWQPSYHVDQGDNLMVRVVLVRSVRPRRLSLLYNTQRLLIFFGLREFPLTEVLSLLLQPRSHRTVLRSVSQLQLTSYCTQPSGGARNTLLPLYRKLTTPL